MNLSLLYTSVKSSVSHYFYFENIVKMIYVIGYYDFFISKYFIKHGLFMDFLERLKRKIIKNFPGISEDELADRLLLAKHLIALEHSKQHLKGKTASCHSS